MAEGGARCIKFLVFFFNFLFFVFGIAIFGFGIYAEIKIGTYVTLSSVDYVNGSRLLIAVGGIIATISFFGCCGAWKENRCLLGIFFVLLLIMLGLEIAAAVFGYKDRDKIEANIKTDIDKAMEKYPSENKRAIDDMQKELKCCGTTGPLSWFPKTQRTPPESCNCADPKEKCDDLKKYYSEGCADKLETFLKDNLMIISALAITILVIQIMGMILAMMLICSIGRQTYA